MEGPFACTHDQRREGHCGRLIADRTIRLSTDEREVSDIVRLPRGVSIFQHGLGEDVMELQPVLCARVIEGNGKIRSPILCAAPTESEEHCIEQNTAFVPPLQFCWSTI